MRPVPARPTSPRSAAIWPGTDHPRHCRRGDAISSGHAKMSSLRKQGPILRSGCCQRDSSFQRCATISIRGYGSLLSQGRHGVCGARSRQDPAIAMTRRFISTPRHINAGLADLERLRGEMFQIGVPVLGDREPGRHPDAFVLLDVVEEAHQRSGAAGTADDAAMQADRHHLG
jgi:hypothetical protein